MPSILNSKCMMMINTDTFVLNALKIFIDNNFSYYSGAVPSYLPILHLDVTERCNARCRICNLWQKPQSLAKDELTVYEIERMIKDARKLGCLVVSLGGGEPTVREDIYDIIRMIHSYGMNVHMDTNGFLLNKKSVERLKKSGLKVISISLDSHIPNIHNDIRGMNCFNVVVDGIRLLKRIAPQIKIIINCVLNKRNINDLVETYKFVLSLGVDGIKFPPIHRMAKQKDLNTNSIQDLFFCKDDIGVIQQNIKKVIKLDKEYGLLATSYYYLRRVYYLYSKSEIKQKCLAGITTALVMPYGDVTPCYNFYNRGKVAGNVRERSFLEVWRSTEFRKLRKETKRCKDICWDLCTKGPSLRMSPFFMLTNFKRVIKELDQFL